MKVGAGLLMQSKPKAKEQCTLQWDGRQAPEGVLQWRSQGFAFIGVCRDVVSPGKLGYMSLTLRDWAMFHLLLPWWGEG
jgi:hypothetical protein